MNIHMSSIHSDIKYFDVCRQVVRKARHAMADWNMLRAGRSVLVGVSGGPDSVALLHVLHRLSDEGELCLGVAHFHHNVRGRDADMDASFVNKLSEKLSIPFYYEKNTENQTGKTRCSPEERLRDARYGFLQNMARKHGFDVIAVGHHADDNAEQILLNLLRGSGSLGISGIPPIRGNIIRPLIGVTRDEILSYLTGYRLDYRLDPTNTDRRFMRNRIRHELVPLLRTRYNPGLTDALCRLGTVIHADNDWLDRLVEFIWSQVLIHEESDRIVLSLDELHRQHPAACRRLIRRAVWRLKGNLRRLRYSHVDAVMDLIQSPHPGRLDLPDRIRISCRAERLVFEKSIQPLRVPDGSHGPIRQVEFIYRISENDISGRPLHVKEADRLLALRRMEHSSDHDPGKEGPHVAFFDWDRLSFPLTLRNPRPGDRFIPLGLGGTQKLSDFFINRKIDRRRRSRIPILVSGSDIVWVVGQQIADVAKITDSTRHLLRAEIST
jgi:tRNA(Ile)-lysidine synthase